MNNLGKMTIDIVIKYFMVNMFIKEQRSVIQFSKYNSYIFLTIFFDYFIREQGQSVRKFVIYNILIIVVVEIRV